MNMNAFSINPNNPKTDLNIGDYQNEKCSYKCHKAWYLTIKGITSTVIVKLHHYFQNDSLFRMIIVTNFTQLNFTNMLQSQNDLGVHLFEWLSHKYYYNDEVCSVFQLNLEGWECYIFLQLYITLL